MSTVAIFTFVLVVLGVIASIFVLRIVMNKAKFNLNGISLADTFASFLLAVQIQIMNSFYGDLALGLNNHENHRTDTGLLTYFYLI